MKTLTLYQRRHCPLCRTAREVVERVRATHPFELLERDVDRDLASDDPRKARYALDIPVIELDGHVVFRHEVSADALTRLLTEPKDA